MIEFRNKIGRYAVYITIVYLALICLSPVFHNHSNYPAGYSSPFDAQRGDGNYKTDNLRSALESQSSLCPACMFEKNNTASFQTVTSAKSGLFAAANFPLKNSFTGSPLFRCLHVRAPPTQTIS